MSRGFKPISRRNWLAGASGALSAGAAGWWAWRDPAFDKTFGLRASERVPVTLHGPNRQLGHLVRAVGAIPTPTETIWQDVLIAGAGVSGLIAGYQLKKRGVERVTIFDLENEPGGNARSGQQGSVGYPWGAHYLPQPDASQTELRAFLQDIGVIQTVLPNGQAVYPEEYLNAEPQERLFVYGKWQEGLVPKRGQTDVEQKEFGVFFSMMDQWRKEVDPSGRRLFVLPLSACGWDERTASLDQISFKDWIDKQGFHGQALLWYLNYSMRDDFGTPFDQVSAWAGIHYFAARRSDQGSMEAREVLTWPEGNGFLVHRLRDKLPEAIMTQSLVLRMGQDGTSAFADVWKEATGSVQRFRAPAAIAAMPFHVARRVVQDPVSQSYLAPWANVITHAPWLVAQLHLTESAQHFSPGMAWDNVLFQGRSLGYILANHQLVSRYPEPATLTFYRPLDDIDPKTMRALMEKRPPRDWWLEIEHDLKSAHPDLAESVASVSLMLWAHAMVRPVPGSRAFRNSHKPFASSRISFAHTDFSGMSLFEEAFDQGSRAAERAIPWLTRG